MVTTNPAGFFFYWPEGSPFIEVFRPHDEDYAPFEVIFAGNESYSQAALNKISNESKEYAHV